MHNTKNLSAIYTEIDQSKNVKYESSSNHVMIMNYTENKKCYKKMFTTVVNKDRIFKTIPK